MFRKRDRHHKEAPHAEALLRRQQSRTPLLAVCLCGHLALAWRLAVFKQAADFLAIKFAHGRAKILAGSVRAALKAGNKAAANVKISVIAKS